MTPVRLSPFDQLIAAADRALRTLAADPQASRANPAGAVPAQVAAASLSEPERREAAALMRVNHVGEVCAQAMYDAQALGELAGIARDVCARRTGGGRPSGLDAAADRGAWWAHQPAQSLCGTRGRLQSAWLPRGWAIE